MEIPKASISVDEESTSKIIDAAVDIFSPGIESLGWLGDHIRVHRVNSAIKAFAKAKELADLHKVKLIAPPTKFLAQMIECSSLEDPEDDELINTWAALLLNASHDFDNEQTYFVSILKQISGIELDLLEMIARDGDNYRLGLIEEAEFVYEFEQLYRSVEKVSTSHSGEMDEAILAVISALETPGTVVANVYVEFSLDVDSEEQWQKMHPGYTESEIINWNILRALNLVAEKNLKWRCGDLIYRVLVYFFTPLGARFYFACHEPGWPDRMSSDVPYARKHKAFSEKRAANRHRDFMNRNA